jgi:hypothetical protein
VGLDKPSSTIYSKVAPSTSQYTVRVASCQGVSYDTSTVSPLFIVGVLEGYSIVAVPAGEEVVAAAAATDGVAAEVAIDVGGARDIKLMALLCAEAVVE